jgi:hypothetical protein
MSLQIIEADFVECGRSTRGGTLALCLLDDMWYSIDVDDHSPFKFVGFRHAADSFSAKLNNVEESTE